MHSGNACLPEHLSFLGDIPPFQEIALALPICPAQDRIRKSIFMKQRSSRIEEGKGVTLLIPTATS
jgi:hypothetical protein